MFARACGTWDCQAGARNKSKHWRQGPGTVQVATAVPQDLCKPKCCQKLQFNGVCTVLLALPESVSLRVFVRVGHIMSSNQLAAEVAQRRLCCEWAGWHRVEWPTRSGSEKPENFSNFAGNMKPLKLQLQTKCEMETGNILTAPKTHTQTHACTHPVNLWPCAALRKLSSRV